MGATLQFAWPVASSQGITQPAAGRGRIGKRFVELRGTGRAGLIPFIMAGDPDRPTSVNLMQGLVRAGADLIELGVPFSDPMADGADIQASALRALQAGSNLTQALDMVADFRRHDQETPIVLMGYHNPLYRFGLERFHQRAWDAGVDGLIVVDLPPEEDCKPKLSGLDLIRLIAPTTSDQRLPTVLCGGSGFVYYVSVTGTTGAAAAAAQSVRLAADRLRRHTELPIAAGFGIRTPQQAAAIAREVDAVVIGSAVVAKVGESVDRQGQPESGLVERVLGLIEQLAQAVRTARVYLAEDER